MKYGSARMFSVVVALGAVALLGIPGVVHAQSWRMDVKVPFEFYIGEHKLPAGHYAVRRGQDSLVYLSDANGHQSATFVIPVTRRSADEWECLIFNRYGDSYFLAEVHWGFDRDSQFPKSSRERAFAKNVATEQVATTNTNR